MKPPEEPRPGKVERPPQLSRSEDARRIIQEYIDNLREIIKKLRRGLNWGRISWRLGGYQMKNPDPNNWAARLASATNQSHIALMVEWKSTRQPPKTKAELYEMLAEAVRNTQSSTSRGPKRPPKPKRSVSRPSIRSADPGG